MTYEEFDVAVPGGSLRVCRWPGDGPVVLAAHGITSNALAWVPVVRALAGKVTLVAPDLRGRAGSAAVAGPYSLAAHADDLIAIVDHLGLPSAPIVGHSMGAFVAALAGVRHPSRVSSVLLVDGGVSLAVPPGADIDAILHAVIGPAMARLQMTFQTRQSYVDFWRPHPALSQAWSPDIEAHVLRDLTGEPPALRSSCVLEAVRADAAGTLLDEQTTSAVHRLACPTTLLWAQSGIMSEPQGLYDPQRLASANLNPAITVEEIAGVNHYTILLSPPGASRVADHIGHLT